MPPASSSAAGTPRTASSPPTSSLSLSLSLSLSMVLLILLSLASLLSFLTLVHARIPGVYASGATPAAPPFSSLPPTSARLTTLFPATMAAGVTLLVPTSTLPCPCFSRSSGTGPELSPLLSVRYPAERVVACRAGPAIPLSTDHKPDRSDERQRIEDAGGFVIWAGTWRVGGVLAVSRAFGDKLFKACVIANPEIQEEEIDGADLIILASEGLWNVFSNKEAAMGIGGLAMPMLMDMGLR